LRVHVDSFKNGGTIPNEYAFCVPAAQGHSGAGPDVSPSISWSKGPRGIKSYVIILRDTDSPAEHREMMNKEGVTMTAAIKRHDFYHWVLADIPPDIRSLKEGADSTARVVRGKPATPAAAGLRGLNDYTKVTAGNEAMKGQYFGYDGRCPPWNDEIVHHYHFTVYALRVKSLHLPKEFDGPAVLAAMKGEIMAQARRSVSTRKIPPRARKCRTSGFVRVGRSFDTREGGISAALVDVDSVLARRSAAVPTTS
jgi:Raf kinase inhibitor-like YbhB/YbcL family protein